MIQPDETRITAYHEAGHAVMAHLLGHQVLGCSVDGDDLGEGWVKLEDGNATVDRHTVESGAKIGLAAFAAEKHIASQVSLRGIHDLMFVLAYLECEGDLDLPAGIARFANTLELLLHYEHGPALIKKLGDKHAPEFRKLFEEVGGAIDVHWLSVDALAGALIKRGTLDGHMVSAILKAAEASTAVA